MLIWARWKKKLNQKKQRPLKGLKKLANYSKIELIKKAGMTACFFLNTLISTAATDPLWQFSEQVHQAYLLVLNLQPDKAQEILNKISDPAQDLHKLYVLSLSETVDVIITEYQKKFKQLQSNFTKHLQLLETFPNVTK